MNESTKDAGVIVTLLNRFEKQRLPRALALKEKVDGGATLDDYDLGFLEEALTDASQLTGLLERHPEYKELAEQVLGLYKSIVAKAEENDKGR